MQAKSINGHNTQKSAMTMAIPVTRHLSSETDVCTKPDPAVSAWCSACFLLWWTRVTIILWRRSRMLEDIVAVVVCCVTSNNDDTVCAAGRTHWTPIIISLIIIISIIISILFWNQLRVAELPIILCVQSPSPITGRWKFQSRQVVSSRCCEVDRMVPSGGSPCWRRERKRERDRDRDRERSTDALNTNLI